MNDEGCEVQAEFESLQGADFCSMYLKFSEIAWATLQTVQVPIHGTNADGRGASSKHTSWQLDGTTAVSKRQQCCISFNCFLSFSVC